MSEKLSNCPVCDHSVFSLFLNVKDHFLSGGNFSIQECNGCGFRFVNPRPDKTEIGQYYQSENYISHDASRLSLMSLIYKTARTFSIYGKYRLVRQYTTKGKILDIGCGTGEFLKFCSSKGLKVTGVEPSDKARAYAQETNKINVGSSLPEICQTEGPFECVTMWHVLEHVHDLNATMETVKHALTSKGIFIVAVPNSNSPDARQYGEFWAAYDVPRHLYHFTRDTLHALSSKHGFEILKILPQKLDSYYVSMLSNKYRSGRNNYFNALISGFRSNFAAGKQGMGHSSQIFVLSVKKP